MAASNLMPAYDHIVVVVEENHSFGGIIGNPQAPYINSLASGGALLTNYHAITHPSQPNYFALYAGSTFGVADSGIHNLPDPTLATVLQAAGKSFVGYIDPGSPRKHNPWESFPEGFTVEQGIGAFPADFSQLPDVSFVVPNLVRFPPRTDLVEYNLGRLADERGDDDAAEEHYRAALAANPRDFLSCLNLGSHAARRRDWPAALGYFQQASALEPASDDAESNLGGVYMALGDFTAAEQHLDRALTLNPQSLSALQNGALLRLREGDPAGARELARRLLAIDPRNPAALRLRERLGE